MRLRSMARRYLASAGLVIGIVLLAVFVSGIPNPSWPALLGAPLAYLSWRGLQAIARESAARKKADPSERVRSHARAIREERRRKREEDRRDEGDEQ